MVEILSAAIEVVRLGAKRPTVAKLAGMLGEDEATVIKALAAAPDHVKQAFGIVPAKPRPVLRLAAFRLPR